jgi:hypothetical protein
MSATEKGAPWQNRTEIEIRELKRQVRSFMGRAKTPKQQWNFCQYTADLRNLLARPLPNLHHQTPHISLISEYLEFSWYDPIWYFEPSTFPEQGKHRA